MYYLPNLRKKMGDLQNKYMNEKGLNADGYFFPFYIRTFAKMRPSSRSAYIAHYIHHF
jgi:hypothetical protein